MGSRETNFYVDLTHRFGFGEVADEVQGAVPRRQARGGLRGDPRRARRRHLAGRPEDEVAERIEKLADAGVDRLICSPVHVDPAQRLHTIERLAALVGVAAPA